MLKAVLAESGEVCGADASPTGRGRLWSIEISSDSATTGAYAEVRQGGSGGTPIWREGVGSAVKGGYGSRSETDFAPDGLEFSLENGGLYCVVSRAVVNIFYTLT